MTCQIQPQRALPATFVSVFDALRRAKEAAGVVFTRDIHGVFTGFQWDLPGVGLNQRFHLWMSFSGWLINRRFPLFNIKPTTRFFPQKQCCLFSSNLLYVNECFKRKKLIIRPLYLASLPLHLRHWGQPSQLVFITHSGHNKWRFPKMGAPQNVM